jgi:hypothetical protein
MQKRLNVLWSRLEQVLYVIWYVVKLPDRFYRRPGAL